MLSEADLYKKWSNELIKERRDVFLEEVGKQLDKDVRFSNRPYFVEALELLDFSNKDKDKDKDSDSDSKQDIVLIKNKLLASLDQNQFLIGVLIHNSLKNLFIKENTDECFDLPTEEQEKKNKKQFEMFRAQTAYKK